MFHAEEHCASVLPSRGFPWAVNPDCLRFLPQKAYRHHRYLTSTTACWLISRCIIIGHSPLRACPPQTGCTPAFPLGSLDAIFFTAWLAGYGVIPSCARSPAFLSGIFQCAFRLPVSYPHTRHERIPGRDHLSRKSSSHKVLTEKHVLRGY